MTCRGRGRPPRAAAAPAPGGRPLRRNFRGTKFTTRTGTKVNIKTETGDGNLEVLQQSQMQNEAMASQSSCQTKSSLAGHKNVSPAKGPYKRSRVDATEVASPGANASNTGQHLRPCKKSKSSKKHDKLQDNEGATGLRRPPTPINLFEDECVFCHSFRTTKKCYGKMVQYLEGRIMPIDEGNPTNAIYVHKKCIKWAPKVYRDGDIYVNVETEIRRASKLKCSRCRVSGAALGCCHYPRCTNTYHVTCARMIRECTWDTENRRVWCPKHAPDASPCNEMSSPIVKSDIASSILQNQYLNKDGISVSHRREDQQIDQVNTLSSSFGQGRCSDKEGISANYRREGQTNHSRTLVNQWVILGSVLSASEKDSLKEFASLTNSTLAEEWNKNVTHVIVGSSAGISCGRSYEVLMAILSGKWVVTAEWIVDCLVEPTPGPKTCLAEPIPVPEISYEVTSIDGPKKGRAGAAEVAPKLFSGLYFCLSAYMNPEDTENIKNLIAAAKGQVLEGISPCSLKEILDKNPAKEVYFIYVPYCLDLGKEMVEAFKYEASGAQLISQEILYGAIEAYDARKLRLRHS